VSKFFDIAGKSLKFRIKVKAANTTVNDSKFKVEAEDLRLSGFEALRGITEVVVDYMKKYGVDKTGRRVPPGFNYALGEGVIIGHDKDDPQVAVLGGAGSYKLSNLKKKALGEAKQLAADIANGEYKNSAYNVKQLANTLNTIVAAEEEMEKLYFGEDYTGEFAAEVTPAINPYGGLKDRKHRGAISETPTDNPTGASGEGGLRKYRPKPSGTFKEDLSQADVDGIARFADKLYKKLGIDITFTKHFMDRVNDERNGKPISGAELVRLFKREYERWGKDVAQMGPDMEGTFKDLSTDINLPFVLRWDRDEEELDLVAKTVMRKKNFKTDNQEFPVDEDTAYAGGMGQGGNAGESYRRFKPKSAGTFKEDELDEACWKGYHKEGNKKMFGKTYPNCVKNTNEEQIDELSPDLLSRAQQKAHDQKQNIIDKAKSRNIDLGSYGDPKSHPVAKAAFAKDEQERKFSAGARKASERDQDRDALKDLSPAMKRKIGIEEEQLDEKCWDSHKQVGMKNKGGRQVPNCVPKESAIMKGLKRL
jgi:Zn finger protein HypA/HybF involved in hydrogenase expression